MIAFLHEMQEKDFSKIPITDFVFVSDNLDDIIDNFETYKQKNLVDKFV